MKRRCLFLDRDGVINEKLPEECYVRSWEEFTLIPAIVNVIQLAKALDMLVIVVTNQRGVARGIMTADAVEEVHWRMRELLASQGAGIDDVYYCPHDRGACECRKPRPGMVLAAQAKWNIDLGESLMIGDSPSDRELANNCGLRFLGMRHGRFVAALEAH